MENFVGPQGADGSDEVHLSFLFVKVSLTFSITLHWFWNLTEVASAHAQSFVFEEVP